MPTVIRKWRRWSLLAATASVVIAAAAFSVIPTRENPQAPIKVVGVGSDQAATQSQPALAEGDGISAPTSTTLPLPEPVFSATSGNVSLEVRVDPIPGIAGQPIDFAVSATDRLGGLIQTGIAWGDRPKILPGNVTVDCRPNGGSPDPGPSTESSVERHVYRLPGIYTVTAVALTAHCDAPNESVEVLGTVVVTAGTGPTRTNGPSQPYLNFGLDANPHDVPTLGIGVRDEDGYVQRIVVEWGDGSPASTFTYPLADCRDPIKYWPSSSFTEAASHQFPGSGDYLVRVTVTSSGCDGRDAQSATSESVISI